MNVKNFRLTVLFFQVFSKKIILCYLLSKTQIILVTLRKNVSLFSIALRTEAKMLSMAHKSLKPISFLFLTPPAFSYLSKSFRQSIFSFLEFFQTFSLMLLYSLPSFLLFFSGLSLGSFWEAISGLQWAHSRPLLLFSQTCCHLISIYLLKFVSFLARLSPLEAQTILVGDN